MAAFLFRKDIPSDMKFSLNNRLAKGGFDFGKLGICHVLLKNNSVFPWFVLIPEVDSEITELHQLSDADYLSVNHSMKLVSEFIGSHFKPDKLNTGAIGNIVRQLHIHLIARYEADPAWPDTVWGSKEKALYPEDKMLVIKKAYENYFKQ